MNSDFCALRNSRKMSTVKSSSDKTSSFIRSTNLLLAESSFRYHTWQNKPDRGQGESLGNPSENTCTKCQMSTMLKHLCKRCSASHMLRCAANRLINQQNHRPLSTTGVQWVLVKDGKTPRTNLLEQLEARIRLTGPITVAEYMKEVLTNPTAGYYMHKDVFGEKGDFITSPEISQMFGELIGVWCTYEWTQCGSPSEVQIVELGPGRGTLADDMLRVFTQLGDIKQAVSVHLVEVSPTLSEVQKKKLCGESTETQPTKDKPDYMHCQSKYGPNVSWYKYITDVPRAFTIFIAHEFFDALPIHKFQKKDGKWREVLVEIENNRSAPNHLRYALSPGMTPASILVKDALAIDDKRDHIEICPPGGLLIQEIANRVEVDGGMALIADYGYFGEKTDTFRGFKEHKLHDALAEPGTADLTADVDFAYLKRMVSDRAQFYGPITQRDFLGRMGIGYRAEALVKKAPIEQRRDIISGYDMLINPEKMGERFKFIALSRHKGKEYQPAGFSDPAS